MSARYETMTRQKFEDKINAAKPGEWIIYHVGFLMWDAHYGIDFMKVFNTQSAAWEAMEAGKVELKQEKIMDGIWKYIAEKKAPPYQPVVWEGSYGKRYA